MSGSLGGFDDLLSMFGDGSDLGSLGLGGDTSGLGMDSTGAGLGDLGLYSATSAPAASTGDVTNATAPSGQPDSSMSMGAPAGSPTTSASALANSIANNSAASPTSTNFLDTLKTRLEMLNKGMGQNQQTQAQNAPSEARSSASPQILGSTHGQGRYTPAQVAQLIAARKLAYGNLPGGSSGLLSG